MEGMSMNSSPIEEPGMVSAQERQERGLQERRAQLEKSLADFQAAKETLDLLNNAQLEQKYVEAEALISELLTRLKGQERPETAELTDTQLDEVFSAGQYFTSESMSDTRNIMKLITHLSATMKSSIDIAVYLQKKK